MTSARISFDPGSAGFEVGAGQLPSNPRDIGLYRYPIADDREAVKALSRNTWHVHCISNAPRISPKLNASLIPTSQVQFANVRNHFHRVVKMVPASGPLSQRDHIFVIGQDFAWGPLRACEHDLRPRFGGKTGEAAYDPLDIHGAFAAV
jgi:hypothetical protein